MTSAVLCSNVLISMEGYLTIKEAADYLKVHPETIRRWVKEGKLPAYKGPKIVRFKKEDLDNVLALQVINKETNGA